MDSLRLDENKNFRSSLVLDFGINLRTKIMQYIPIRHNQTLGEKYDFHTVFQESNNKDNRYFYIAPIHICFKRFTISKELKRKFYETKIQNSMIHMK